MWDKLRPLVSRVIGAGVAGTAACLESRYGVHVDPATQLGITGAIVAGVYGITHRILDRHVNPGDAATSNLAADSVTQNRLSKRARRVSRARVTYGS